MAKAQTKEVTKRDLEASRLSAVVHNVSMETEKKDLEYSIKRQIGLPLPDIIFGKPYETDGEKLRNVFLNFKREERVNELMNSGPLKHQGQELEISRHTPKNCPMSSHITSALLLTIHEAEHNNGFKKELTEYDLQKYFEKFDQIIGCEWQSHNKVILQFRKHDSVNRIILDDVSHTINGIKVDVQKALPKEKTTMSVDDSRPYCIHVTDLPVDVTSEELSPIFSVHIADILLQPGHHLSSHLASDDLSTSEAWIKHRSNKNRAQDLVTKHSKVEIRGFRIRCNVVQEPFCTAELCRDYEKGDCKYSSDRCNYKHIMCNEPDECEDRRCWYGHSGKRQITSDRRPVQDFDKGFYRVRISNLPSTTTKEQLLKRLNIDQKYIGRVRYPDKPVSNGPMVAYLINQPSENLLRHKLRSWHNSSFSYDISNKMKCQMECNMDFFDDEDHGESSKILVRSQTTSNTVSNIHPTTTKFAPWFNGKKDTPPTTYQVEQSNGTESQWTNVNSTPKTARKKAMRKIEGHDQGPSDMIKLAPQWRWTHGNLSNDQTGTRVVYSLVDKKNKEDKAVMIVYKTELNPTAKSCARRERIVLEKVKGLGEIPKFIASNINAQLEIESNNDPWIIIERIEGVTMSEFIRTNPISFRDKVKITLNLLNIVKQIHSRNIVHRHINPNNILIRTSLAMGNNRNSRSPDEISLVLIGFHQACFIQDDEFNNRMIFKDDDNHIPDAFYQSPQLARQSSTDDNNENLKQKNSACSPTTDTSSVCAVLFWMITKCDPKESENIHGEAPHQRKDYINTINAELSKATGIWTDTEKRRPLEQHLTLIFNRGFARPNRQWSVEELTYQLQHMLQLATKNHEENSIFFPIVSKKQKELSSTPAQPDSFLRLASLIDWMKRQFQLHYSDVHWSVGVKGQWLGHSQLVKNMDILTFQKQQRSIVIDMISCAEINKNQELLITITARIPDTSDMVLPLGIWKQYEQEDVQEEILKTFELELKILIDILYKKKDYAKS